MSDEISSAAAKLKSWYSGKPAGPDMVQIYPTNGCNLKCIFCVQRLGIYDPKDVVSKERWFEVTKEICKMKPREILISGGGEPLFAPETTIGIMKIVKENGINGRLITNGTLWAKELIEKIVDICWDHIIFSIDGLEKTHDFLRGTNGSFRKIVDAIDMFNEVKEKFGSGFPILEMTTVLNIHNYKEVSYMVDFAHSLGLKSINLEPICINNPEDVKFRLNVDQRKEFFENILPSAREISKKYGILNNFDILEKVRAIEKAGELKEIILGRSAELNDDSESGLESGLSSAPCYEPWLWPKIEANGEVWPCSTVSLKENIREKSFKEIWFGEKFNEFRKMILEKRLPDECNNCVMTHIEKTNSIRERLKSRLA